MNHAAPRRSGVSVAPSARLQAVHSGGELPGPSGACSGLSLEPGGEPAGPPIGHSRWARTLTCHDVPQAYVAGDILAGVEGRGPGSVASRCSRRGLRADGRGPVRRSGGAGRRPRHGPEEPEGTGPPAGHPLAGRLRRRPRGTRPRTTRAVTSGRVRGTDHRGRADVRHPPQPPVARPLEPRVGADRRGTARRSGGRSPRRLACPGAAGTARCGQEVRTVRPDLSRTRLVRAGTPRGGGDDRPRTPATGRQGCRAPPFEPC